jgi:predicted TIM-barrel fold metal-dependent hydrolase
MQGKDDYFRYARRFDSWVNINSHYMIDSLAITQRSRISTLEELENSLRFAFGQLLQKGMTVVKVPLAYSRTLNFENTARKDAEKVFRRLMRTKLGDLLPFNEVKQLQDYMFYRLMELAREHDLPVAIHTGLLAGKGNMLNNSNPLLLSNVFTDFPDVRFVLYHGSYPFGGELSALAKMFANVYIDMNWMYSISPSYSERYLNEWLETVPVSKLMAFGGDYMAVENVYSELHITIKVITNVLTEKVKDGYYSEEEAKTIARMILHDNAAQFYKLS